MRNPRGVSIEPTPLLRYSCAGCGYGASRRSAPSRCPMCGGRVWAEEGWTPFAAVADDLVAAARRAGLLAGTDSDAPLVREEAEVSVFPGVPLS